MVYQAIKTYTVNGLTTTHVTFNTVVKFSQKFKPVNSLICNAFENKAKTELLAYICT